MDTNQIWFCCATMGALRRHVFFSSSLHTVSWWRYASFLFPFSVYWDFFSFSSCWNHSPLVYPLNTASSFQLFAFFSFVVLHKIMLSVIIKVILDSIWYISTLNMRNWFMVLSIKLPKAYQTQLLNSNEGLKTRYSGCGTLFLLHLPLLNHGTAYLTWKKCIITRNFLILYLLSPVVLTILSDSRWGLHNK